MILVFIATVFYQYFHQKAETGGNNEDNILILFYSFL